MSQTNRLLGYPDDARLLILNADDLGMYDAINEGVLRAFKEGLVRSTSLMVPWPSAGSAMKILAENPDLPFSVHLSVICDIPTYRVRPLVGADKAPSLVDETGTFHLSDNMDTFLAQARLDELEAEFRAQIETVLNAGLKPTHLDWHCLHSGGRADIFDMTMGLAMSYGLALRVGSQPHIGQVHQSGLPCDDYDLLDSFTVDIPTKNAQYAQLLHGLPPGLSEWAVHPSTGDAASQAIDPGGWQVRRSDFDFLISPEAREIIRQEGITLLDYRPLQQVWQAKSLPV